MVVVKDWDDLESKKNLVKGKIVCFDFEWKGYGATVQYRNKAGYESSKLGAVGALIRSITPFSMETPHTGM